jgi:hypothetical protein
MEAKRAAFVLAPYPFSNEGRRNATNRRAIGVDKAPDTILARIIRETPGRGVLVDEVEA